jgi:LysM repeat protein
MAAKENPSLKLVAYRVQSGDTLSAIAMKTGVRMEQIRSWNKLQNDRIYVGQTLALKGPSAILSGARTTQYTIKGGDTLGQVAARFGTSVADLQRLNKITNASSIHVGQSIMVPVAVTNFTTHTVKPGDSLGLIAKRNKCSVTEIKRWNNLRSTVIYPGQKLKIKQ